MILAVDAQLRLDPVLRRIGGGHLREPDRHLITECIGNIVIRIDVDRAESLHHLGADLESMGSGDVGERPACDSWTM